ncbi:MAG: prolyl-tRNA synthetase associated domain-containing protein [Rhizomicrobium sp.]
MNSEQNLTENTLPEPDIRERKVYAALQALDITWHTHQHRAVFTVEESAGLYKTISGAHTKNLFLKDQKGGLWLVSLLSDTRLDLKALAKQLGAPRFSFGNPELLITTLGIAPGAVNAFAVMNDTAGKVRMVLDEALLHINPVNFHPMRNDRTTAIAPEDIIHFLKSTGHDPIILPMPVKAD